MVSGRVAWEGARRALVSDHHRNPWLPVTGWASWDPLATPLVEVALFGFGFVELVEVPVLVVTASAWVQV